MTLRQAVEVDTGKEVTLDLTFQQLMEQDILRQIQVKGKTYQLVIEDDHSSPKATTQRYGNMAYNRALRSVSGGVHSTQAAEFNTAARKAGITGVYYDPKNGDAYFESRSARRKELKRRGLRDGDGGYGDG